MATSEVYNAVRWQRVSIPPLACSVRGCGAPIRLLGRAYTCPRGHTHDVARSGYVNLLQPQDRRAPEPGDARSVVEARARLLAEGVGATLVAALVARVSSLTSGFDAPVVVDLGSGTGDALSALAAARPIVGIGIELSKVAATIAARRFPDVTWVVANADRRLPLLDGCAQVVLSVHARRNPLECRRVLAPAGALVVAVPAHDDLIELREEVLGERVARDRSDALLAEHASAFTVVEQFAVRTRQRLDPATLRDVLRATYRGGRQSAAPRVDALQPLEVTLASDVSVFTRS